jgi:glycerate 2-kinase
VIYQKKHYLICLNSFKNSINSVKAVEKISAGLKESDPNSIIDKLPLTDGGQGTLELFEKISGVTKYYCEVPDALGRIRKAYWLKIDKKTALIESAQAIGLEHCSKKNNPLNASTEGVGFLWKQAVSRGCEKIYITLGGSATTDAGTGMARVLGWKFLDKRGRELKSGGGELKKLYRIEIPFDKNITQKISTIAWCDVRNPLLGVTGAARIFAPQKGATLKQVDILEAGLKKIGKIFGEISKVPNGGAAGGLGAGLMFFLMLDY